MKLGSANWYPTNLAKGSAFTISGVITSSTPIEQVSAEVKNTKGKVQFTASAAPNAHMFNLYELDGKMAFSRLPAGRYTYTVTAADTFGSQTLLSKSFTVKVTSTFSRSGLSYPTELKQGDGFSIKGTVNCSNTIREIGISVYTVGGEKVQHTIVKPNAKSYNISKKAAAFDFSKLEAGDYVYRVDVVDKSGYSYFAVTKKFSVLREELPTLYDFSHMTCGELKPYLDAVEISNFADNTWYMSGYIYDENNFPAMVNAWFTGSQVGDESSHMDSMGIVMVGANIPNIRVTDKVSFGMTYEQVAAVEDVTELYYMQVGNYAYIYPKQGGSLYLAFQGGENGQVSEATISYLE